MEIPPACIDKGKHYRFFGMALRDREESFKKYGGCQIIAKYHVQICEDMEAVGFPVQNFHKMAYGDENTTFEPVNGYCAFTRKASSSSGLTQNLEPN